VISWLAKYFNSIVTPLEMDKWLPENFQTDHKAKEYFSTPQTAVCPFYDSLVGIAELLTMTRAECDQVDRFCGLSGKGVNDIGILSGRSGTDYYPHTFCINLLKMLGYVRQKLSVIKEEGSDLDLPARIEEILDSNREVNDGDIETTQRIVLLVEGRQLSQALDRDPDELLGEIEQAIEHLATEILGVDPEKDDPVKLVQYNIIMFYGLTESPGSNICPQMPKGFFDGFRS